MPRIASFMSYPLTLLHDLGKRGHITGAIALSPGKHALHDGRYIDIAPQTRAHPAGLPVNPYRDNARSPGLIAYMSPVPVLRLPPTIQTHLGIKSLHLDSQGEMRLQGELGGARRRRLNYTHGPVSLAQPLNALNKHFTGICAKVAQHPIFSDVAAFDLDCTDLTWTFAGGPTLSFDAEDRLPFRGWKSDQTEISIRPERGDTQQSSSLTLRVKHAYTLLTTEGPNRAGFVELYATLAKPRARLAAASDASDSASDASDAGFEPGASSEADAGSDSESDGPVGMSGAASSEDEHHATYCAAIYAGLMDSLDVNGHFSLAEQHWSDLAALFPAAESQVRGWRVHCRGSVQVNVQRRADDLHMQADKPVRLSLPATHIPVRIGWLQRLLSHLLVVSVQEASICLATSGEVRHHLPLLVQNARLQLGWIPIPIVRINRQFNLPLPPTPELLAHVDRAAAKIAEVYTFSPLVNLSHLVDLSQSDLTATSDRYCQCELSEAYTLHAQATSLHLGKSTHYVVGGRVAIDHAAQVVDQDSARDLRLGAAFNMQGGALPIQTYVGDDPPGPSIQVADGVPLRMTLGPEATQTVIHAVAGGLKGLAVGGANLVGRGLKAVATLAK